MILNATSKETIETLFSDETEKIIQGIILLVMSIYSFFSAKVKRKTIRIIKKIEEQDGIKYDISLLKVQIKKITDKLDNNIYSVLFYDLTGAIKNVNFIAETDAQHGLMKYFKVCIRNLVESYYHLKNTGIELIKDSTFVDSIYNSAYVELSLCYNEKNDLGEEYTYPYIFIKFVDDLQICLIDKCLNDIKLDLSMLKEKDDNVWEIVKSNLSNTFQTYVLRILLKFKEIEPLIGKKDVSSKITLINKDNIIELIKNDEIKRALSNAHDYFKKRKDKESLDIIIMNQSRFSRYVDNASKGLDVQETTLNEIKYAVLQLLESQ